MTHHHWTRRRGVVCFLAALWSAPSAAEPCRATFLEQDRPRLTGELLLLTERAAVILVAETARTETLVLTDLYLLEASRREINSGLAATATIVGGILGGVVGALIGQATCRDAEEDEFIYVCANGIPGALLGTAVGIGLGLAIGLHPTDTWTTVYVSPEAQRDGRSRSPWDTRR